jgi:translation initiation factor IF-3
VRVIGPDSEQLGVLGIRRALDLAKESELDLVEISPTAKPPVCRIMDYSKYKYDQEKKERRIKKNQHVTHLKEIRLKPHIGEGDYQTKLKQTLTFLSKKDKVKVSMMFRGRELAHREIGKDILERVLKDTAGRGEPESGIQAEGRMMTVVLTPISDKTSSKPREEEAKEE